MLGGSTLGIGVTMFLRDQFSGPAARIRSTAAQMEAEMVRMQQAQLRQQRNMYAGLAMAGVMAVRGMGRMVKKAAQFSYEMEFVKSITQATGDEQMKLERIAKTLGRETMFYPQAIAEGMRFMAMAGMSAAETEKNIQGAVNLAGATKSELGGKGGAADIMTNVMKQFKVGFEYTNDVADLLSFAVTRANTNLFDLGEALKYAGSTSMDLNISLGESTAMVMALGNAGLQGSMAGVAMENSMRYMSRAFSDFGSGPSQKALAELGLTVSDVTDSQGDLLTMTEVMKKFGNAIEGVQGNIQRQAILQNVFGVRGKRAGSLFIRNLQEFERFSGMASNVKPGYAAGILDDMMSTLQGHMYKLGSAWQAMWVSFTDKVGPMLIFIMKGLVKTLGFLEKVFDKKILGGFFAAGIAGFITLKTVSWAYKAVVSGIRLAHLVAQSSAAAMSGTTVAGYNAMTAAATRYKVSALSTPWMGAGRGATRVAAGQYAAYSALGVRHLAKNPGAALAKAAAKKAPIGLGAMRGIKTMAVGGATRGAARFAGGRLMGLLGGPAGLAITTAMFVLPGLLGAIIGHMRKNQESTDQNTKALEAANRSKVQEQMQYTRVGHMIEFMDVKAPPITMVGSSVANQVKDQATQEALSRVAQQLEALTSNKTAQPVIINIDNEEYIRKYFDRNISDSLSALQ